MYNKNMYWKGMVFVIIVCIFFGTGIAVPNINGLTEESCNESYMPSCTDNNSHTFYYGYISPPDDIVPDNIGKIGTFPPSWDWRNAEHNGKVGDWCTPVRNQGSCGSCWAFSAIGALEAIINIREGSPYLDIDLSEQQLLSCPPDSGGCDGWSFHKLVIA